MEILLNTNVIETNLLNLAVVLWALVSVGGDVLDSLLEARKETILKTIRDANERYEQRLKELTDIKQQYRSERLALQSEGYTPISLCGDVNEYFNKVINDSSQRSLIDSSIKKDYAARFETSKKFRSQNNYVYSLVLQNEVKERIKREEEAMEARLIENFVSEVKQNVYTRLQNEYKTLEHRDYVRYAISQLPTVEKEIKGAYAAYQAGSNSLFA